MKVLAALLPFALAEVPLSSLRGGNGNETKLGCSYVDTCTAGGVDGVCMSVSAGCCTGGTTTSGLCSGSNDIMCCTAPPCTTPYGSGTCVEASSCSGTSYTGYCSGPSDVQ
jgi:hypothetical protein